MGKGVIAGGGSGGLYQVTVRLHRERIAARLAQIETLLADGGPALAEADAALVTAQAALDTALAAMNGAIADFRAGTITIDEVREYTADAHEKARERDTATARRNTIRFRIEALTGEKNYLNANMPLDYTVNAWCADLTENLSGEVGLIEQAGDRDAGLLIRPGYSGGAAYSAGRDGIVQPAIASTPFGSIFNWSLRPAWQKWMPQYRIGTISNIDTKNDTCTVILDPATSRLQKLNVNASDLLTNVPVQYMGCNARAFADGDRVVVEFSGQDYQDPRVIGFESNPRSCVWEPWGDVLTAHHPWFVNFPDPWTITSDPYLLATATFSLDLNEPTSVRIMTETELPTAVNDSSLIKITNGKVIEHRSTILSGHTDAFFRILLWATDDPTLEFIPPEHSALKTIEITESTPEIEVLDLINDLGFQMNWYIYAVAINILKAPGAADGSVWSFRNDRIDFYQS